MKNRRLANSPGRKWISLFLFIVMLCGSHGAVYLAYAEESEGKLTLPAKLKVIGVEAFKGSASIDDVVLPDQVSEIRFRAFADSSIRTIHLPASITYIAEDAFDDSSLEYATAKKGTYAYDWAEKHSIVVHDEGGSADDSPYSYRINETNADVIRYSGSDAIVTVPDDTEGFPIIGIGESAFAGNTLVKKVYLPYGLQRIGERAFAQSGLLEIYIPSTVTDIAANAFDDLDSLTIYTDEGTYPWQYAETYGYSVENQGSYYRKNNYDHMINYMKEGEQLDEKYIDLTVFSLIPTDGITDKETLESIETVNGLIAQSKAFAQEYNEGVDAFVDDMESNLDILNQMSLAEGDDMVAFTCGDMVLNVGRGILDKNDDEMEYVNFMSNVSKAGTFVLENNVLYDAKALASAFSSTNCPVNVEKLEQVIGDLNTLFDTIKQWIDLSISNLEDLLSSQLRLKASLETTLQNLLLDYDIKVTLLERQRKVERRIINTELSLQTFRAMQTTLIILNVPGQLTSVKKDIKEIALLQKIREHGHPTVEDITGEEKWLIKCEELNENIVRAQILYGNDGIITILDTAGNLASIVGNLKKIVPASPKIQSLIDFLTSGTWSSSVVKEVISSASNAWAASIKWKVSKTDAELHGYVIKGRITSKADGRPLQYVRVVAGGKDIISDANGEYRIMLHPGKYQIRFIRDGYNTYTQDVEITNSFLSDLLGSVKLECKAWDKKGRIWHGDIELEEATVNVSGYVYDYFKDTRIDDVVVTNGTVSVKTENGHYSIDLPIGEQELTFRKEGYFDSVQTFTLKYQNDVTQDIILHKKTGFLTGTVEEYDPYTGKYSTITNTTVTATCEDIMCIAAFDGYITKYEMELKPGKRTITFRADGYKDKEITVEMKAGGKTAYNIYLEKEDIKFELFGDATILGENSYQLTPLDFHQHGSIWSKAPVSTKNGIIVSFDYWAGGGHDNWAGGADGILFQFSPTRGSTGDGSDNGINIGAVGVELDSYYAEWDCDQGINAKHIAIIKDYFYHHLVYAYDTRVDDGAWHNVKIDYQNGRMKVYLDKAMVLSTAVVLPDSVYLGASASTGNGYNRHRIANISVQRQ